MAYAGFTQEEKMTMASFLAYQDLMVHLMNKGLTAEQADEKIKTTKEGMDKMKELSLKYYNITNE